MDENLARDENGAIMVRLAEGKKMPDFYHKWLETLSDEHKDELSMSATQPDFGSQTIEIISESRE